MPGLSALSPVRQLRRARLALALAVLIPTLLMSAAGVVLVTLADSAATVVLGVIVLALCLAYIAGYVLSTIFVARGASAAVLQHDFLSAVSHELRTPLTSIRLLMEAMRTGALPAAEQAQVGTLLAQECDRLDALVGRLLELARLESGRHPFEREPLDVASLCTEAVAAFDAQSLTRPTPITLEVEPGLSLVGDRATLVRALANLLHNAWKYTGDDKQIALPARSAGRKVELSVSDNGIGLRGAEHRVVFERFTRGTGAIERGTPGAGLGLAFVRAIARGHRGRVRAEPRPGGGTIFTLRLRRGRVPAEAPASAVAPARAA